MADDRCCGEHPVGIAGEPLVLSCQLCPNSPTYWASGDGATLLIPALDMELETARTLTDSMTGLTTRCDRGDACVFDRRCPAYDVCLLVNDDQRDYAEEAANRRLCAGGDL